MRSERQNVTLQTVLDHFRLSLTYTSTTIGEP